MKYVILLLCTGLLLTGCADVVPADDVSDKPVEVIETQSSTEEATEKIQERVAEISASVDIYDVHTEPYFESTEGGEVRLYSEDGVVSMISETSYGEMGKLVRNYYYDQEQLVLVHDQMHHYNRPMYYDEEAAKEMGDTEWFDDTKTRIEENKYYFNDGTLIQWIGEGEAEMTNEVRFREVREDLIAQSAGHIEQWKNRNTESVQ